MQKHLSKIAWTCLVLSFVLSMVYFWQAAAQTGAAGIIVVDVLFLAGMSALAYLTFRVVVFRRRLTGFVRHLLAGNYDAGIRETVGINDETTRLEKLLNNLADQLRTYDKLFAERVSMSHRALELLYRTTAQAVIMADVEKRAFRFNPSALALYNVDQKSYSFDAIEKLPANAAFVRQFHNTVAVDKVPVERRITLQIPVRNEQLTLDVKIVPLKDYDERVQLVLILICADGSSPTGPAGL